MIVADQQNIYQFRYPYYFLSNFWRCSNPIDIIGTEGELYLFDTVEHAYQAWKSKDCYERRMIENQPTPGLAKQKGKRVTLRSDWSAICQQVMHYFVQQKFQNNSDLLQLLINTHPKHLYEGNRWGDHYWGVDLKTLEGQNHLGRILMNIREKFIHSM